MKKMLVFTMMGMCSEIHLTFYSMPKFERSPACNETLAICAFVFLLCQTEMVFFRFYLPKKSISPLCDIQMLAF